MKNESTDHYNGMPEYNNEKKPAPLITAKFKFRSIDDYEEFHKRVKFFLYDGAKVFDGMQKKTEKQAWYPLPPRPSHFVYEDEK